MIQVTKAFLPDFESYVEQLRSIWSSGQLTNHGTLVERLEEALRIQLGVRHLVLACNGTVALQIAIRALELEGDVVTTPFSYVATTSSLVWEGCRPVFADIDPGSLCIDPERTDEALASGARGILATHVYGNACDIDALAETSRRRGVRLLFDAAHAFGASFRGRPLAAWGDAAILSFHATKLFHSAEGGALATDDDEVARRARYLRNFGHRGTEAFWGVGINGKMSELHAAMGLCVLPRVPEILEARRRLSEAYDAALRGADLGFPAWHPELERNYAYYPVLFRGEDELLAAQERLRRAEIFPRRYFYPALSELPYLDTARQPIAESVARRVLCLPMGHDVGAPEVARIAGRLLDRSPAD